MKVLLTNGDSWTQGDSPAQKINWDAKMDLGWYNIVPNFGRGHTFRNSKKPTAMQKFYDSDVWPKVLGRLLEVETWNAGRLGDDNLNIALSTIRSVEWLLEQNKKDIFVVVGWSSPLRVPAFVMHEGRGLLGQNTKDRKYERQQIRPGYTFTNLTHEEYFNAFETDSMNCSYIYTLQSYLVSKGIDFLFFNAFDHMRDTKNFAFKLLDKSKWVYEKVGYSHFDSYIKDKYRLADWTNETYYREGHPTDVSHTAWAEELYSIIA